MKIVITYRNFDSKDFQSAALNKSAQYHTTAFFIFENIINFQCDVHVRNVLEKSSKTRKKKQYNIYFKNTKLEKLSPYFGE